MIQAFHPTASLKTGAVYSVVGDVHSFHIPGWIDDLNAFRRWIQSDDVPEKLRAWYFPGEVWVDMSTEQFFSHNQVKQEYSQVLGPLAKRGRLGRYSPDGMRLTNPTADFSAVPDGVFISEESFRLNRVRLVPGRKGGFVELEGTPDMALEIISDSSTTKDDVRLRELYFNAGIPEYWLVDARGDEIRFEILRRASKGYKAVRKQAGWIKSTVFGKSFQLTRQDDALGHPEYTLAVR